MDKAPWDPAELKELHDRGLDVSWPPIFARGQFALVTKGKLYKDHAWKEVAVKVIDKVRAEQLGLGHSVGRQRLFFKDIKSRFIVEVYKSIESHYHLWVPMELIAENLTDFIMRIETRNSRKSEEKWRTWFSQIMDALRYMHHKGWTHRRMTTSSILCKSSGFVLGGFSQVLNCKRGLEARDDPNAHRFPMFCSPKRISRTKYDPYAEDVYALGMVIYITMNRNTAFRLMSDEDMIKTFMETQMIGEIRSCNLTQDAKNFILKLVNLDEKLRPRMKNIIKDPWVTMSKDPKSPYAQWPNVKPGHTFGTRFAPEGYGKPWDEKNATFPKKLEAAGYRLENLIGEGGYGFVFKAWKKNQPMACKIVDIKAANKIDEWYAKRYTQELDIIRSYDHPNLCKVFDVFVERNRRSRAETEKEGEDRRIFIFMELCVNDLWGVCRVNPGHKLHELYARRYLHGVAEGLRYLHTRRVAHRDMKTNNILVRNKNVACVTDFSYSKDIPQTVLANTFTGTLEFRSPQILQDKPYNPYSADVWAYGCCISHTITGKLLIAVPTPQLRMPKYMLKEAEKYQQKIARAEISDQARDLVRKCVAWNEKDRIPFATILNHEWFKIPVEQLTYNDWPEEGEWPHPDPAQPPHPLVLK